MALYKKERVTKGGHLNIKDKNARKQAIITYLNPKNKQNKNENEVETENETVITNTEFSPIVSLLQQKEEKKLHERLHKEELKHQEKLRKEEKKQQEKLRKKEEKRLEKLRIEEEKRQEKLRKDEEKRQEKRRKAQEEELEKQYREQEKLKKTEVKRKCLIRNSLVDNLDISKTAVLDTKKIQSNKRYKPYFKLSYKICRGLSNLVYSKTLKLSIDHIDKSIVELLGISQSEYKKNMRIQDITDKNVSEYETDEILIRNIIIENYSIIPNMLKRIKHSSKENDKINICFDTDVYDEGYDISSLVIFDKNNKSYISIELSGGEDIIELNKSSFDSNNIIKEVADKIEKAIEYYDRPMINYIYHNLDFITNIIYREKKHKDTYEEYREKIGYQINQLLNSIADLNYKKHSREVIFKPNEDNHRGRKYALQKATYQSLPKSIRHLIGQKYYVDIDMKNAHFNISKFLILNKDYLNNEDYPNILKYAEDRLPYYNDIKTVFPDETDDNIKQTYLSILFNQDFQASNSKYKSVESFNKLVEEIKLLQHNLYNNEEYHHHIDNVRKIIANEERIAIKKGEQYDKDNQNIIGRVLSRILQEVENSILEVIIEYLKINNIKYSALQYDGLQLIKPDMYDELGIKTKPRNLNLDDALLCSIEEYIKSKLNIDMPLSYKTLESKIEIPSTYIHSYEREYICMNNETDIENLFVETNRHILNIEKNTNTKFIFDTETNIWSFEPNEFKNRVKKQLKNQNIYNMNYKTNLLHKALIDEYLEGNVSVQRYNEIFDLLYGCKLNQYDKDLDTISSMVIANQSYGTDDFDYKINNSTIGTISFKNGVWFFKKRLFKPYPVPEIYSTKQLQWNYKPKTDKNIEDGKFIIERLSDAFYDCNKDLLIELLMAVSKAVAGFFIHKFWILLDSYDRSSGKGNLVDFLKSVLGESKTGYYTDLATSHFAVKSVNDELKDNSFLIPLRFCRIGVVQEPPKSNKLKQDGAKIKSSASGGDAKSGRYFYTGEKISFVPHLMYMILCNKGIEIEGNDAYGNCLMINYDYCFIDKDNITDETKQKESKRFFGEDIKDLFKKEHYIEAFIHLLIDFYDDKPFSISKKVKDNIRNKMFLTGKTDGYTSILTKFKKTDNKHHRLSVSFFDYFKKEIKYANNTYDDIKFLSPSDYKMGLNQLSQTKKMRKCLNEVDLEKSCYGFEGIWFNDEKDVEYIFKYMASVGIESEIKARFDDNVGVSNDLINKWVDVVIDY